MDEQKRQVLALVAINPDMPMFDLIRADTVRTQMNHNLEGSGLTVERLVLDCCAYLTANPKTAAKAKPAGVFNCLLTASRLQTSFGDGGLWIIPEGEDVRPQESEKFMTGRAKEDRGLEDIEAVLVHAPDAPFTVDKNSTGQVVGFNLNSAADPLTLRDEKNLLGGFGVAYSDEGKPPRVFWFPREELDRFKSHSAALKANAAPAWRTDPLEMHKRSIRAAVARRLLPSRVRAGTVGSLVPPQEVIEVGQTRQIEAGKVTAESAADELLSRTAETEAMATAALAARDDAEGTGSVPESRKFPATIAPFPMAAMPAELAEAVKGGGVQIAFNAIAEAWAALPMNPDDLYRTYRAQRSAWAKAYTSEAELKALHVLLDFVWAQAEAAGFKQPNRAK